MSRRRSAGTNPRATKTNPRATKTNPRRAETTTYLRSLPYAAYLKTDHWRRLREAVLTRWAGKCEECGQPAREVHHRTYERLGHEHVQDLTPLCADCHRRTHEKIARVRGQQRRARANRSRYVVR